MINTDRETREKAKRRLEASHKDKKSRKSEPGSGLAPPRSRTGSKSAGNTPNSSPTMNKLV
jgi:hypothetical protein